MNEPKRRCFAMFCSRDAINGSTNCGIHALIVAAKAVFRLPHELTHWLMVRAYSKPDQQRRRAYERMRLTRRGVAR